MVGVMVSYFYYISQKSKIENSKSRNYRRTAKKTLAFQSHKRIPIIRLQTTIPKPNKQEKTNDKRLYGNFPAPGLIYHNTIRSFFQNSFRKVEIAPCHLHKYTEFHTIPIFCLFHSALHIHLIKLLYPIKLHLYHILC